MQPETSPLPPARPRRFRWFVITLLLLAIAWAFGHVPQRMENRKLQEQLDKLQVDHDLAQLHRRLGVATQEAMRNNYASAATAAGAFFTGCTDALQRHPLENEPRTRNALTSYAQSRDTIMAELAAGDPASRERLAGLFLAMDGVLARRE